MHSDSVRIDKADEIVIIMVKAWTPETVRKWCVRGIY